MNIKVITRHAVCNYGSLLQAIATEAIFENLGHNCEIIDYYRDEERGLRGIRTWLRGKKGWSENIFKKLVYIFFRYPEEKVAEMKFARMQSEHLKLTPHCSTIEELRKLKADLFVTGSDQVWGLTLNDYYDKAYFLPFVKDTKKIAFSSSFGRTDFSDNIIEDYKRLLSKYDSIAVREDSAVALLNEWGLSCEGQVMDPTLLLDAAYWKNIANKSTPKNYILVYQIHNKPSLNQYAKKFSEHVGLPVIRISPYLHQITRGGKLCWLPNINGFLSYIRNCSYLITDSFHGTAFALNFNKQFIEVLEDSVAGIRNKSILKLTHLEDRIVTDLNDFSISERKIDFEPVNKILDSERKRSLDILKTMLSKIED